MWKWNQKYPPIRGLKHEFSFALASFISGFYLPIEKHSKCKASCSTNSNSKVVVSMLSSKITWGQLKLDWVIQILVYQGRRVFLCLFNEWIF